MSRIYEALRQAQATAPATETVAGEPWPALPAREDVAGVGRHGWPRFATAVAAPAAASRLLGESEPAGAAFAVLAERLLSRRRAPGGEAFGRVAISSSAGGEGKSFAALNLALAFAHGGERRVLLVEGNLRSPALAGLLGVGALLGLGEWLAAGASAAAAEPLERFVHELGGLPLWLLAAGAPVPAPLRFLESERAATLLRLLAGWFDWILIDTPPLWPHADAAIWSRLADGLVLVIRPGCTRRAALARALRGVDRSRLLGVLVNGGEAEPAPPRAAPRRVGAGAARASAA